MLLLTEPGDTSNTLAYRILGNPDDSYAKKLREMNKNTLAYTSLERDYFLPNQLIWCPEFSELDNDPVHREMILSETQFIPSWGKVNISKLQSQGVDVNDTIAAAKVANDIEQNKSMHGTNLFPASMASKVAMNTLSRGIERYTHPASVNHVIIDILDHKLEEIKLAEKSGNKSNMIRLNKEFKQVHEATQNSLQRNFKFYNSRVSSKTDKIFSSSKTLLKANKKGIKISNIRDLHFLDKIASLGRWVEKSAFYTALVAGSTEVITTMIHGGNWRAKAFGLAGSWAFFNVAGQVFLRISPQGRIILIALTVGEVILFSLAGETIQEYFEGFENKIEKGIHAVFDFFEK